MPLYSWILRIAMAGFLVLPVAAAFQWLWNGTMPAFRLDRLTYWQAVRLILLFSLLVAPSCTVLLAH